MNGKTAETTPPASTNEQSELMKFGSLISNSIINLQETMQDSFSKFRTTIEETWYEDGSGPQEVSRYQISESGSSGDESADENQPKTSKRPRIGASPVGQETAARVSDQPTDKSAASPSGGKTSSDNVLSAIAGRLDMKEKTEKCLQKVAEEEAQGVILVPVWPTQTFFPILLNMLIDHPRVLPKRENLLILPHSMEQHPLKPKLWPMACYVSGSAYKQKAFQMKLRRLFLSHGEREQRSNVQHILKSGNTFVVRDRLIELRHL
ncbi:uncharacterized protein LOC116603512 isoform X4 [Nematostella vectensis]|uniref:uncharacterized protein LOC116603512 isoform X4 n=1 Tax=Nematostella vectensis TaxID=45351 RepID=UPI0020777719|nr:uncharacterized protein LOC116603512 isoform X4 [Nematostella vectensis]